MKRTTIILTAIVILIMLSAGASAVLTDNLVSYYKSDNSSSYPDSVNNNDGTISGSTYTSSGKINGAYDFDGTNDYVSLADQIKPSDLSISVWIYQDTTSADMRIVDFFSGSGVVGSGYGYSLKIATNDIGFFWDDSADAQQSLIYTTGGLTGGWHHIVATFKDGVEAKIYLDGSLIATDNTVNSIHYLTNTDKIFFGRNNLATNSYFDGKIDEIGIWNRTLTLTEINESLYNSGTGLQYPFGTGSTPSNFTVTVTDEWNSADVNNISVSIDGQTYSNTTGNTVTTHILDNSTNTYNINISANNYISKNYTNINVSSNLAATLHQTEINFIIKELISGNTLSSLNCTINSTTQSCGDKFNLTAQNNYTILVEKTGYYSKNFTINATALEQTTKTLSGLYNNELTFNLTDFLTSQVITQVSHITLNSTEYTWSETYNNANGSWTINSIQGNFTARAWATNYAFIDIDEFEINDTTYTLNKGLYANNSVWVTAKDFDTGATLTNFTVQIYNSTLAYQYDDNNTGTARKNDIQSGYFTIKIDKDLYSSAEYPITVAGGSHQEIIAYLIQSGNEVIFTVANSVSGAIIEQATSSMYKLINATWTLTSSQLTDITGRVQFSYTPDIEYKYTIQKSGFTTKTFFLTPLFSSYTINLDPDTVTVPDTNSGNYFATVSPTYFMDEEENNLTFTITSGIGSIEYYNVTIIAPNVNTSGNFTNAIGGTHDFSFNISGAIIGDTLKVYYGVKESGYSYKTFMLSYPITNVVVANGTFLSWGNEANDAGILTFEKAFIAIIIMMLVVGLVAWGSSAVGVDPLVMSGLTLVMMMGFFAWINFIGWWSLYIAGFTIFILIIFRLRS